MYLKQIELENFKSFGGKLTIPILEGYVAITGPNGSGKSNIADAILFVLGPKSSKAIRAGKLTDLIFDGGKSRKAADFMRVSLVFENSDRMIPWDADTVRLTRLVRRSSSGDGYNSYFYVNDQRSSLKEFEDLLANARISADGYNLVQQGDVTRIVEMGNLERRRILDAISGITHFDDDISKAEEERLETEQNLERISIIRTELELQLEQLGKEKVLARRYLDTKAALDRAKAELVYKNIELVSTELESTERQMAVIEKEIDSLERERRRVREESKAFEEECRRWENEIATQGGEDYNRLKERHDHLMIEEARMKDRAERAEMDIATAKDEMEKAEADNSTLSAEIDGCVKSVDEAKKLRNKSYEQRNALRDELQALKKEIDSRGGELAKIQEAIAAVERELEDRREEEHHLSTERDGIKARLEALYRERSSLEEELETAKFEAQDAEWQIRERTKEKSKAAGRVKEIGEELRTLKEKERTLTEEEKELRQALFRLERDYSSLKAEKEAEENLKKGYNRAISTILEARDRGKIKGIHGTVAELAEVDPQYETALSVAAGGRMQAIIVDDDHVASECIELLKRSKAGRATFLPLNKMQDGRPRAKAIMAAKQSVGYAIDLVRFDPIYRQAFWHVLGDTVVTEDLTTARRLMGGVRLVTLDGELIEAAGAMVGGSISNQGMRFGASSAGKLEAVAEEMRRVNEALEKARQCLNEAETQIRSLEEEMRNVVSSDRDFEKDILRLEQKREEARNKRNDLKARLDNVMACISNDEAAVKDKEALLSACKAAMVDLRQKKEELQEKLLEMAPEEVQRRLNLLQDNLVEAEREASVAEVSFREVENRLHSLRGSLGNTERHLSELRQRLEELGKARDSARSAETEIRTEMAAVRSMMRDIENEMKELQEKRDIAYRNMVSKSSEAEGLKDKIDIKRDILNGFLVRIAETRDKLAQFEAEAKSLEIEIESPLPSMDSIKTRIRQAERSLEMMGNVNLRAIEDYEEKKARYDSLCEEIDRLEAQREELLSLMDRLSKEKKTVFNEVFKAVDRNFRSIYAELSGGGEAYLSLEDSEDPFLGGLIINAKPRNGKLLRLEALSGGEKSLTALAFIFALQEYQPSPFYLLDEVDMFLDAVNAEMVAKRVKDSCSRAQFVQISLRKVTLSKADHLIGVTRQPNGVSKVIMEPNMADIAKDLEKVEGSA